MKYDTRYDERLFSELYDVQPQAIVWMRPIFASSGGQIIDFEFTYTNNEGLKYLNLTREQFAGLTLSNSPTLTDELRERFMLEMKAVYETGKHSETTVFNQVLNKFARVLRTRLRDGVLTVVQDITKEKEVILQLEQQARELQEQKSLLDNILKNSSNGISVSKVFRNEDGKVVDALTILANDAAIKYIGFPKEIYLTKRATEIEPAVIGSPYYQACIKTLETGEPFLMQYRMESTGRWLELTVSRMDHDHLIQVFTDVTAMRQVQSELEHVAATLKLVFDSAQTGMFTFAPEYNAAGELVDFRFVMVNSTVAAYVAQKPDVLEGELGSKWFPGYLTNGVFDMYKHTFETGEPLRKEVHYNTDGHDNYLDLQSVKIGEQLLVSLTDHTSLRKSQLQLEETVKALERSNTYLEDFAHAASHDMKEPLRKIRVFSQRLQHTLGTRINEDEKQLFDRINTSAERMQLLVDDLLEFSHVNEQPRQLELIDLNEKVRKVLSDLELPIEEKGAQIFIEPLPAIRGNRRQLQQLFHNLIGNALKYGKAGTRPEINIRSRIIKGRDVPLDLPAEKQNAAFHLIEISDNGIGFEQQYARQIFELFKRLHSKAEYAGTGVGLSIAKKVTENHGGYIWASGEPDQGATFRVLLPVHNEGDQESAK